MLARLVALRLAGDRKGLGPLPLDARGCSEVPAGGRVDVSLKDVAASSHRQVFGHAAFSFGGYDIESRSTGARDEN